MCEFFLIFLPAKFIRYIFPASTGTLPSISSDPTLLPQKTPETRNAVARARTYSVLGVHIRGEVCPVVYDFGLFFS
jgi:hypothetical protein